MYIFPQEVFHATHSDGMGSLLDKEITWTVLHKSISCIIFYHQKHKLYYGHWFFNWAKPPFHLVKSSNDLLLAKRYCRAKNQGQINGKTILLAKGPDKSLGNFFPASPPRSCGLVVNVSDSKFLFPRWSRIESPCASLLERRWDSICRQFGREDLIASEADTLPLGHGDKSDSRKKNKEMIHHVSKLA